MNIGKVLLVDDDANIRKLAKMSLERVGHWSVTTACSGTEALDLLSAELADLIILDVMMPGLDGRATLEKLKERPDTRQIPVILMTAKVGGQEILDYLSLGADGVIIKPFDPLSLPQEIRHLLESAQAAAENKRVTRIE